MSIKVTKKHLETILTIRYVEQYLLDSYKNGNMRGTTHTYIGQEAIATAVENFTDEDDVVISNHRCHGHFIANGGSVDELLNEIKGDMSGVCKGIGGSQHLCSQGFFSNGIQGGMTPISVGIALANKIKKNNSIVIIYIGDGTLGEGVVYEALNMASLLSTPVLFIVENNYYAQSTPISTSMSGSIIDRFKAFGISTRECETNDIGDLLSEFEYAFSHVRENNKPFCQIVNTYRVSPHSKGDDFRDPEEIERWKKKDPIILAKKYFNSNDFNKINSNIKENILKRADYIFSLDPLIEPYNYTDDTLIKYVRAPSRHINKEVNKLQFVKHLNLILDRILEGNENSFLIGEDILDPYGGAFKVTKGLSTKYPKQVISTPISEQAIVGLANGLALSKMKPIVEIMFGDFTTLIVDQVLNHATKFQRMYSQKVTCPIVIRTPMGGYRGYGPTHSQSLEKMFIGFPGLIVISASTIQNQEEIWDSIMLQDAPVLYIESKSQYSQQMNLEIDGYIDNFSVQKTEDPFPIISMQIGANKDKCDLVIMTYGSMTDMAMKVSEKLFIEHEHIVKICVLSQLSPYPVDRIVENIYGVERVLLLEEGTLRNGWGSEICSIITQKVKEKVYVKRVGALDTIIPSSLGGEESVLPSMDYLYKSSMELINEA